MHGIIQNKNNPHQNRVDPFGNIIRTKARGAWMGNRGLLHDSDQQILRSYKLQAWLICCLHFKNRKRQIMAPNSYTELFFLDEATAFSAGHRPCCECRREDSQRFKEAWCKGNSGYGFTSKTSIREIDKILQKERVAKDGTKLIHQQATSELSDGIFISLDDKPYLFYNMQIHLWTPFGYQPSHPLPQIKSVSVLTPKSIVNTIRAGYYPQISIEKSALISPC